jgi:hypothetical protein
MCDVFAEVCCPVRVRPSVLLDSAWTASAWCGCNVQVAVLTTEHIDWCAVTGTRSRFVRGSLIFWNKVFVSGCVSHCLLWVLYNTMYSSRWLKKLIIYFYCTFASKHFDPPLRYNKHELYIVWVHPVAHVTMKWVQQSFISNNVSACFIKHVYHNMFHLKSKPSSGVIVYWFMQYARLALIIFILGDLCNMLDWH